MAQYDGDYFRTVRFGGFHKEDVMRYIEGLEQRLHDQCLAQLEREKLLREARQDQLRWMEAARLQRRRSAAANQVQQELAQFQRQLAAAQELLASIERENGFLRERIRVLEEGPFKEEPASVPLEQLTFRLFLEDLDDEDPSEFSYLSI